MDSPPPPPPPDTLVLIGCCIVLALAMVCFFKGRTLLKTGKKGNSKHSKNSKWRNSIPSLSPSDPELGNMGDIGSAGNLHLFLKKLHGEYGPIVGFWWKKTWTVSIASPELWKFVIQHFDRPTELFALFSPLIGLGSLQYANSENGLWRRKTYVNPAYTHSSIRDMFSSFETVAVDAVVNWNKLTRIPLHEQCMDMAMRAIAVTSFGHCFESKKHLSKLRHYYSICWKDMESRIDGNMPVPGSERDQVFKEAAYNLRFMMQEVIDDRRAKMKAEKQNNQGTNPKPSVSYASPTKRLIDYLIEAEGISDQQIVDEAVTFIVGGFHTTGNLLTWLIYYVTENKNVQQQLQQELDEHLGKRSLPTFEECSNLPYMSAVVKETLRCCVLAPWAARFNSEDCILDNRYFIPANTPIIHALGVALTDETIFPEPQKFNPRRFVKGDAEEVHLSTMLAYSPFGFAGKRICPGKQYAQVEAIVILAGLLKAYNIDFASEDSGYPAVPVHGLVTSPKSEIYLTATSREHPLFVI